jgi:hypothetical protein
MDTADECQCATITVMSNVEAPRPRDPFGFTERERLFDRLSHQRLLSLIADEQTHVHSIELSENKYGEFLFIQTSRPTDVGEVRACVTFWGAGYHDQRERWLVDEWFWYDSDPRDVEGRVEKGEAQLTIEKRLADIAPYNDQTKQSKRGKFFEMMADLTDEDGAYTELEDWAGELPDDFFDDE